MPHTFSSLLAFFFLLTPSFLSQAQPLPRPSVAWSIDTGGPIWGSSTTREGITYFGSTDGTVYALRVATGETAWTVATGGAIYGDVAVYEDYLYVGSDDGFLYKLHLADGSEIWRFNLHEAPPLVRYGPGNFPPEDSNRGLDFRGPNPVEANGIVYVGSPDKRLYAIDAETATKRWHAETNDIVRSKPVVADGTVVFGSYDGMVYAHDAISGAQRWTFDTGAPITPGPLFYEGMVYIGNRSTRTATGTVYALNLADGTVRWQKVYGEGSWVEAAGTIYDDVLYIGSSFWSTTLALNPLDGTSYWERRVAGASYSKPALTEDSHYSGTVGFNNGRGFIGSLVRIHRESGSIIWRYLFEPQDGYFEYGVGASPEVVDGLILFGGLDGTFYALRDAPSDTSSTP